MQTQVPALAEQTKQHNQSPQQAVQLLAKPHAAFEDARPAAAQLKAMQVMMSASPRNQNMRALQAKMNAGPRSQKQHAQQASMNAKPGDSLKAGIEGLPASSSPDTASAQLKRMAGLSAGLSEAQENTVYFGSGAASVERRWLMPAIVNNTRAGLLRAIALRAGTLAAEIDGKVDVSGWTHDAGQADKPEVASFDPIRVRFAGQYGLGAQHALTLDYHYGSKWSGYVIHVTDTGNGLDHDMHDPDAVEALDAASEYSAIHESGGAGALAAADSADSVTKIAGEGARWQCIAEHAGSVRDATKIYTNENSGNALTDEVRYVTFPVLWKSWQATFNKVYGISDATVVSKLKAANVSITTKDGAVASPVGRAASATMNFARDISVDTVKPAAQPELNPKTVRFLHFKKKKTVIETAQTLDQETLAARLAVSGTPGVNYRNIGGYLGDKVFAFLCDTAPIANLGAIAEYDEVGGSHVDLRYPTYREASVGSLAAQHAKAGEVGTADATYAQEKRERYAEYVQNFVDEIVEFNVPGHDQIDLEAFVKTVLIPWTGVAQALPQLWHDDTRHESGDPCDYYEAKINTYAEQLKAEKQEAIKRRVAERIKSEHPYFVSKKSSEQATIRADINREVIAEFSGAL